MQIDDYNKSTSVSDWYNIMNSNPMVTDALLDIFVHTSYCFVLKGDSLRKK